MDRGINDKNVGVGRGRGIDNVSKGLEIRGRQRRMRRCNYSTDKFAIITEALAEEDKPEVSTTTTEESAEESEDTTRLSERLRRRRRWCVYGLKVLTTTTSS